jgi:hypothetical protein
MPIIVVEDSKRKKRRDINTALGNDLIRYIAELVTNSDDSYKREEEKNNLPLDEPKPIYIEIKMHPKKKGGYDVIVTDNAEGMSLDTLVEKFRIYDDDKAGGPSSKVRGLFGRGASDVLRSAAYHNKIAMIKSVKDGEFSMLKHDVNEKGEFTIEPSHIKIRKSQIEETRASLRIPNNGTQVTFGSHSKMKTNVKDLKDSLEKYYPFHYLLNTPNRKVILIQNGKETVLSSEKYSFEKMENLSEEKFDFNYEGYTLPCTLKMYRNPNKSKNNLKILVADENLAVYDNVLFGFASTNSLFNDISGELIVEGLYDITYDYINAEESVALFRDNRTGFDTKLDFYTKLESLVSKKMEKVAKMHGNKNVVIDLTKDKRMEKALQELNKYLNQELKDEIRGGNLSGNTPPPGGIAFIRSYISITKDKLYDLKLIINTEMVLPSDIINISVNNNDNIELNVNQITYKNEDVRENNIAVKSIVIKGIKPTNENDDITIKAKCEGYTSTVTVDVIEEEIHYPVNGFEFYQNKLELVYNSTYKAQLYFDKEIVPIGSLITFTSTEGIALFNEDYVTSEENLISTNIGCITVKSAGGVIGHEYTITAQVNSQNGPLTTSVKIKLIDSVTSKLKGGGLISKFIFAPDDNTSYQGAYDQHEQAIIINTSNPINKIFFGPFEDIDVESGVLKKAEQRKYFCDVASEIVARVFVDKKNVENGDIRIEENYEDEAFEEYLEYIRKEKTKIFMILYNAYVVDEK